MRKAFVIFRLVLAAVLLYGIVIVFGLIGTLCEAIVEEAFSWIDWLERD